MKTLKITAVIVITIFIVAVASFFLIGLVSPKPAGIYVSTSPQSNVYVNGSFMGKTPFQKTLNAETIDLKLVPDISDQNLFPFETKISLTSGIQTVVRREFGTSDDNSSGDIISFEKEGGNDASLVVISSPENAQVSIDGTPRGFTPYKISTISPADHQITVRAEGYDDRVMAISPKSGFRLTLFAKLAKNASASVLPSPTPSPAPPANFVLILTTPTGYLRVRTEPGTKGEEIGQVKPGDKFPFLDIDASTGWLKIQFEEPQAGLPNGIVGWVSGQYAKEIDVPGSVATPVPTP